MKALFAVPLLLALPIAAANAQGDASCCSEKALEYRKIMMPVQRALDMAYRAGICRLRSEHYFRTLSDSAMRYAMQESRRIGITNAEMSAADAAAKAILADEAKAAGNEDILKSCPHLARDPRLLQLDQLRSEILGNYH